MPFKGLAAEIIETALGRATAARTADLLGSQHWFPDRLRLVQEIKRARLHRHAAASTRHYRETLSSNRPLLTTRMEIQTVNDSMTCRCLWDRVLRSESRGTTGEGVAFNWDRRRQTWDRVNRRRAHAWHGFGVGEAELHLWPEDPARTLAARFRQTARAWRDWFVGDRLADLTLLNGPRWIELPHAWNAFRPTRVTAYPSALCELIERTEQGGRRLETSRLRRVFTTGEPLFPWQRRRIETALGVPVAEMYGVQEVGAIAYECPRGGRHVAAESVLVEFIRGGRPARDGELAEVVATGLESFTMPIIRYCTGDIVRQESTTCSCRLTLPVMPPVLGRAGDFLAAATGEWIEPRRVVAALGPALGDGRFIVRQSADRRIDVAATGQGAMPMGDVRAILGNLLAEEPPVTVRRVERLPRTASMKMRYVMSELSTGGLAQGVGP